MPEPSQYFVERRKQRTREHFIPQELADALRIGGFTGTCGMFVGAAAGVARARHPTINAIIAGIKWFTIGSFYYGSRAVVSTAWGGQQSLSKGDKIKASTIAGSCAGTASALIGGGVRDAIPVAIIFSVLAGGGQAVANMMAERNSKSTSMKDWLHSRWSPLTALTDQEYEKILEEKILKVDVEIALVDDKVATLRASELGPRSVDNAGSGSEPFPKAR